MSPVSSSRSVGPSQIHDHTGSIGNDLVNRLTKVESRVEGLESSHKEVLKQQSRQKSHNDRCNSYVLRVIEMG